MPRQIRVCYIDQTKQLAAMTLELNAGTECLMTSQCQRSRSLSERISGDILHCAVLAGCHALESNQGLQNTT